MSLSALWTMLDLSLQGSLCCQNLPQREDNTFIHLDLVMTQETTIPLLFSLFELLSVTS
jgi:hypothetical protein